MPESYVYDPAGLGNLVQKAGSAYTYGSDCQAASRTAGPHAVCTVGGGTPFVYDGNGNLTNSGSRMVTYNTSNKVTRISNDTATVDFMYGADGNRVVQKVTSGSTTKRTVYVGLGGTGKSLYEQTTTTVGTATTIQHVHYIYAGGAHGGAAFALRVLDDNGKPSESRYYSFDHLGSVTALSDELGRVSATGEDATMYSYDTWGSRRSADGTAATPASFSVVVGAARQFTGQEQIPDVGLVNMNGRLYDPALGRFLSPDPNVQFVADLQSYNRYSYVANNPLRYTDPTGYFWSAVGNWFANTFSNPTTDLKLIACGSGAGCASLGLTYAAINASIAIAQGAGFEQALAAQPGIGLGIGFLKGVGQAVEYGAHTAAHLPVMGNMITGYLAINPMTGIPWAFHNFGGWKHQAEMGTIMAAGVVLTIAAGGLPAPLMIMADAGIGFGEGFGTAKLAGASNTSAIEAGLEGAAIAAGSASLSVASSHFAAAGIQSDADEGDVSAQLTEEFDDEDTVAQPHAFPEHATGEGYSVGPNTPEAAPLQTGAYGGFSRWVSDNIPYANYGGYVQDGMDFNPQSLGGYAAWSGYFVLAQTMVYGGAALTATGGSQIVVQDLANRK